MRLLDRKPDDRDRPICQAASDSGGIASGKCLVSTVPRATHTAPASAQAMPGNFSTLASMPLPPISMAMPASETANAMARSGDSCPARLIRGMAGLDPEPEVHLFSI